MAITGDPHAFKNERTVNAPIDSDDEADFYFLAGFHNTSQQWIGRSQGLGRLNLFAGRSRAELGYVDELGSAGSAFLQPGFRAARKLSHANPGKAQVSPPKVS